ncbi:MAG: phage terminase large subunit [Clostridia bacterium]|nr:phage terminase large subunit [Clostridia bacterium]
MSEVTVRIGGLPNPKQQAFFDSRAKYTAYGGARGGGKSWALRRKLVAMCLRYAGIRCLLLRRTLEELKANHIYSMLREYGVLLTWQERDRAFIFANGSRIDAGYCDCDRDVLRYQGQEYDIIAIDEATQLTEHQFTVFRACLRGVGDFPRRMYLTCNPGGVGHAWVKRLFIDRDFREGERAADYAFISARLQDNPVLMAAAPDYLAQLQSLPPRLRDAWLDGKWDAFAGQFFPEFREESHVSAQMPCEAVTYFGAMDYGFDRLAVLLMGRCEDGRLQVLGERCASDLTLREAAMTAMELFEGSPGRVEYLVASPDLWNRRQDSGLSGVAVMQTVPGMPPMRAADDRRVAGWRMVRQYLHETAADGRPRLMIHPGCGELIRCMQALQCDEHRMEDAASHPHHLTHAPEALRYGVMSDAAHYRAASTSNSEAFRMPARYEERFW